MAKKYDNMVNKCKSLEMNKGIHVYSYTRRGQCPKLGSKNSFKHELKKLSYSCRNKNILEPEEYFALCGFQNSPYFDNSPYGHNIACAEHVYINGSLKESIKNNNFGTNNCDNDILETIRLCVKTTIYRYRKNPRQSWIQISFNQSFETISYWMTVSMLGGKVDYHNLENAFKSLLFLLFNAAHPFTLLFHDKWNKMSRHRSNKRDLERFNALLNDKNFKNFASSLVHHLNFKIEKHKKTKQSLTHYVEYSNSNIKEIFYSNRKSAHSLAETCFQLLKTISKYCPEFTGQNSCEYDGKNIHRS